MPEDRPFQTPGVSRRGFLATVGAGAAGAATLGAADVPSATNVVAGGARVDLDLKVNGRFRRVAAESRDTLLEVLRDELGLTGTKPGCERGECGACTVLIDGRPRYSCMTLAPEAVGREITTVEGLMRGEELGPVQRAFVDEDAFQCGFCTSGQVMAVEGLLRARPEPSLEEVREAVSGNLCRCGAYPHIFKAARRAAQAVRGPGR
jgi:xanthine dehydrogenase YagT iron-sulfur-binding subunit